MSWIAAAAAQSLARPWAALSGVNPVLVWDWAPSFLYALGFALVCLGLRSDTPVRNALWAVVGAAFYEALQPVIPERTFDGLDVAATVASAPLALGVHALVERADRRAAGQSRAGPQG